MKYVPEKLHDIDINGSTEMWIQILTLALMGGPNVFGPQPPCL